MKIEFKTNDKKSNVNNNEKIDITISNSKIVSDLLRKHYAHPIRTLVQEYLSNARDAHREVKNTKDKIIVTLPTKISPSLKIRDFGPGMNEERIDNVFSKLGNSTKRKSNNETGGFGIGSKSAFAYRDNFFVRSFFNGTETLYELSTAHNYEGTIEVMYEGKTKEANGIEIDIPVKTGDVSDFIQAVYRATFFWTTTEKPVIKGINEESIPKAYKKPEVYLSKDNVNVYKTSSEFKSIFPTNQVLFVLDGIPYEVKTTNSASIERTNLITAISFKTGVFKVAISRESIEQTPAVVTLMKKEIESVKDKIKDLITEDFKKAKTSDEMFELAKKQYITLPFNISFEIIADKELKLKLSYTNTNKWRVSSTLFNCYNISYDIVTIPAIPLKNFSFKSIYLLDEIITHEILTKKTEKIQCDSMRDVYMVSPVESRAKDLLNPLFSKKISKIILPENKMIDALLFKNGHHQPIKFSYEQNLGTKFYFTRTMDDQNRSGAWVQLEGTKMLNNLSVPLENYVKTHFKNLEVVILTPKNYKIFKEKYKFSYKKLEDIENKLGDTLNATEKDDLIKGVLRYTYNLNKYEDQIQSFHNLNNNLLKDAYKLLSSSRAFNVDKSNVEFWKKMMNQEIFNKYEKIIKKAIEFLQEAKKENLINYSIITNGNFIEDLNYSDDMTHAEKIAIKKQLKDYIDGVAKKCQ